MFCANPIEPVRVHGGEGKDYHYLFRYADTAIEEPVSASGELKQLSTTAERPSLRPRIRSAAAGGARQDQRADRLRPRHLEKRTAQHHVAHACRKIRVSGRVRRGALACRARTDPKLTRRTSLCRHKLTILPACGSSAEKSYDNGPLCLLIIVRESVTRAWHRVRQQERSRMDRTIEAPHTARQTGSRSAGTDSHLEPRAGRTLRPAWITGGALVCVLVACGNGQPQGGDTGRYRRVPARGVARRGWLRQPVALQARTATGGTGWASTGRHRFGRWSAHGTGGSTGGTASAVGGTGTGGPATSGTGAGVAGTGGSTGGTGAGAGGTAGQPGTGGAAMMGGTSGGWSPRRSAGLGRHVWRHRRHRSSRNGHRWQRRLGRRVAAVRRAKRSPPRSCSWVSLSMRSTPSTSKSGSKTTQEPLARSARATAIATLPSADRI